ncbi:MAG: hypothetical protein K2X00_17745 [Nitrospiraceae bacterium]|nr:hypothetical protein [Nitrospiraceae bacterium]
MTRMIYAGFIVCNSILAHEIPVHRAITEAAVEYLAVKDPQRFGAAITRKRLKELLLEGTALEDSPVQKGETNEESLPYKGLFPLGRYYFHFMDSQGNGLHDGSSNGYCSSLLWGITKSVSGCVASDIPLERVTAGGVAEGIFAIDSNKHDWQAAITKSSNEDGWRHLGYVLHLLEDLSSPAHTRNDRHPGSPDIDPVEVYGNRIYCKSGVCSGLPLNPPAEWNLLTFTSAEDSFRKLQAWTSANFYSQSTTGAIGPLVTASDDYYMYGNCLGNHYPCADPANQRRKLKTFQPPFSSGSISRPIAIEQLKELLPTAVQYVASLIKYYADTYNPSIPFYRNTGPGVIYDSSLIGTTYDLTANAGSGTGLYVRLPFYGGVGNTFPASSYFTLPAPIRYLRVKRLSGVTCNVPTNVNLFKEDGNLLGLVGTAATVGEFCDFPVSGTAAGDKFGGLAFCIDGGCTAINGTMVLDGSSSNGGGYVVDGWGIVKQTGGWAFQLCDSRGCSGGFGR